MKKIKRITLLIAIIFILIVLFNSQTFAYSTNQYSINIPSNYINQGNGKFVRSTGMPYILIQTNVSTSYEHIEYKREYLKVFEDYLASYENKLESQVAQLFPIGYDCKVKLVDSKIKTFTDNNYKCFYFKYKINVENESVCMQFYIVISDNNVMYVVATFGTEEALNSAEVKDIVNSFTIKNYIPKDSEFIFPVDNIIITIAIIFILIVVVLYIMKKNDDRKMKLRKSSKPINLDDYNIGNPYNKHMNAQVEENKQNTYSNIVSPPPQEEIRQDNKIEKEDCITHQTKKKNEKAKNVLFAMLIMLILNIILALMTGNLYVILDGIMTVFAYMFFPYMCARAKIDYTKKEALKIAIINSVVVAIIFSVLRASVTGINKISGAAAFIYGYINYYLLKDEGGKEKCQ